MSTSNTHLVAVFLPLFGDTRIYLEPVYKWLRNPWTLIVVLLVHVFIISTYLSHRRFVLQVYAIWETFDGVKSGTSLSASHVCVLLGGLFTLIPLWIIFMAATGIAPQLQQKWPVACLDDYINQLRPWIAISQVWTFWLLLLNAILLNLLSPYPGIGITGALYGIPAVSLLPLVLLCYLTGWCGLALPTILSRIDQRILVRALTKILLLVGLIIAAPLTFAHILVFSKMGPLVPSPMNFFEFFVFSALAYLFCMTILLKYWIRLATSFSESKHDGNDSINGP